MFVVYKILLKTFHTLEAFYNTDKFIPQQSRILKTNGWLNLLWDGWIQMNMYEFACSLEFLDLM